MKTWQWSKWVVVMAPVVLALELPGCVAEECLATKDKALVGEVYGLEPEGDGDCDDEEEQEANSGQAGAGGMPGKALQGVAGDPNPCPFYVAGTLSDPCIDLQRPPPER